MKKQKKKNEFLYFALRNKKLQVGFFVITLFHFAGTHRSTDYTQFTI